MFRKTVSYGVMVSQLLLYTPGAFAMRGDEELKESQSSTSSLVSPVRTVTADRVLPNQGAFFDDLMAQVFFERSASERSSSLDSADFHDTPLMSRVVSPAGSVRLQAPTGLFPYGVPPEMTNDAAYTRLQPAPSPAINEPVVAEEPVTAVSRPARPSRLKQAAAYALGGAAGLAMTPVFLSSIAQFGRQFAHEDLSQDDAVSLGLRYTSAVILAADYALRNHALVRDEREKKNAPHHGVGKALMASQALLPALFLYDIETAHAGDSAFMSKDQYMAVFYLGVLPLIVNEYLSTREEAFSLTQSREVMSPWKKAVAYGMPIAATFARFFYGYAMMDMALSDTDMNDDARMAVSMVAGGILSNAMSGLGQVGGLRYLLTEETHPGTGKQKVFSAIKTIGLGLLNGFRSLPAAAGTLMGGNALGVPSWLTNIMASHFLLTETLSQTGFQNDLFHRRISR